MVKVISLSNEAYEKLKSLKNERSFSELVIDLIEKRKNKEEIKEFAGIFSGDKKWEENMKEIIKNRKNIKMRGARF